MVTFSKFGEFARRKFGSRNSRDAHATGRDQHRSVDAGGRFAAFGEVAADRQVTLTPIVKRHILDLFGGSEESVRFGWAQLPSLQGRGFSLGLFADDSHFLPLAFADGHGRVFLGSGEDLDPLQDHPLLIFSKDGQITLPDGPRFGHRAPTPAREIPVTHGSISVRTNDGSMMWIGSWLKTGKRYTLEQLRMNLTDRMHIGLEYRDAVAVAFFAGYLLPHATGALTGFGSGNIFRHLNREAPLGAIRHSVQDTLTARSHGMRTSGLEEYFADLMEQAGALDQVAGLEAEHAAEPAHLWSSSYSHAYFLSVDKPVTVEAALSTLKIESAINRFANISTWLERNAAANRMPIENTVTRAQAADIDRMLLENPALLAIDGVPMPSFDDPLAVNRLVDFARMSAQDLAAQTDKPVSEWNYRYTLSALLRRLRLPYRFEADFRVNLATGNAALEFMTAGTDMMPTTRYNADTHSWEQLDSHARAELSMHYNLRVALMLAALAFGADDHVTTLAINMGSVGLEEAVAEQDDAIRRMANEMIRDVDRLRFDVDSARFTDTKDGDFHGDPSEVRPRPADTDSHNRHDNNAESSTTSQDHVDSEFAALMNGMDIDETVFANPDDMPSKLDQFADTPQQELEQPVHQRSMMTVRLERDAFLQRLKEDGLAHPLETMRMFGATCNIDADRGFLPITPEFDITDPEFSPSHAQVKPEAAERPLDDGATRMLGTANTLGLSIQRNDLLEGAVQQFHALVLDDTLPSVDKAHQAMHLIDLINDPELNMMSSSVTRALIDGDDTPDLQFALADHLDEERVKARDLLFSGQVDQALTTVENAVQELDETFSKTGVPRYFNSYAERVVYNRIFATPGEHITLIPDNLFHAHFELAELLGQIRGEQAPLDHLNTMVSYAPVYPLSHLKLAVQFARNEDWGSAKAACLNALRVSLDGKDAAFAYYRLAQALWMRDEFDAAVASYMMGAAIAPTPIPSLEAELRELTGRAQSQCIAYPRTMEQAMHVLRDHDIPVWPSAEIADLVHEAARTTVDEGLFTPARALVVAASRLENTSGTGIDFIHEQLLRSLGEPEQPQQPQQ